MSICVPWQTCVWKASGEGQYTLKGAGQPVLWVAHPAFCYLAHHKSGILQVDMSSKVLQRYLPLPETTQIVKQQLQALHRGEQPHSWLWLSFSTLGGAWWDRSVKCHKPGLLTASCAAPLKLGNVYLACKAFLIPLCPKSS